MTTVVLIPCYNESTTIRGVVESFKAELPDAIIYVYDNNSSDNTIEQAQKAGAIVGQEYHQGKGNVLRSMFDKIDADIYILIDGDGSQHSKDVKPMIQLVKDGKADMVVGDRLSSGMYKKENQRRFHGFGNQLVKRIINLVFNVKLTDIMSGYRVLNRDFVKTIPILSSGFEVETEMTIFALDKKYTIVEVPISFQERPEGSTSTLNTFSDGKRILGEIFSLFRHYKPLPFFLIPAAFCILISCIFGIPVIIEFIEYSQVYRIPSAILAAVLVAIAVIFFNIGVILDTIAQNDKKKWLYYKKNKM